MMFSSWLAETELKDTINDAYGTLLNFHQKFGIDTIPKQKAFEELLSKTPTTSLTPEEAVKMRNTSAHASFIGKGVSDPSVIRDKGMVDQRHDSWKSILHHSKTQNTPVVAIKYKDIITLLDGDHRVMAAVLMNRPVAAKVISWS